MILRTIKVSGWRCYAAPLSLGPFADGINVIHAANGVGKSTLFEALQRGLLDSHRVQGDTAKLLQPWGRDLSPTVTVEFVHEETDYRVEKRFLTGASSQLSRRENGSFTPLAESREADTRVREMLLGEAAGRGLTKPAQWGLAQVLWVPQGDLAFDELSGNLTKTISEALGTQISGLEGGALEQRVEKEYLKYFTTKGTLKSGREAPAHVALAAQLDELQQQRADLAARLDAFEDVSRQVEDYRSRFTQYDARFDELSKLTAARRQAAEKYGELSKARSQRLLEATNAQKEFESSEAVIERLAALRTETTEVEQQRQRLSDETTALERDVDRHGQVQSRVHAELLAQRTRRVDVEQRFEEAEAARELHELSLRTQALDKLVGQIHQTRTQIAETDARLTRLLAPDDREIRDLRAAHRACGDAQLRLDAVLLQLEIVPDADGTLDVLDGEQVGPRDVRAGEPITITGAPEVVVAWKGVGRIRARGPAQSVESLRAKLDTATARFAELNQRFATDDLAELECRHADGAVLRGQLGELRTRLDVLLDGRTDGELSGGLATATAGRERLLREHPAWADAVPRAPQLLAEAKQIKDDFQTQIDTAERRRDDVVRVVTTAKESLASVKATLYATTIRAADIRRQIDLLTADGLDDVARDKRRGRLSLDWRAAKEAVAEIDRQLKEFADEPDEDVKRLEHQLEATRSQQSECAAKQHQAQGRLEAIERESPYSALSHTDEQIAVLTARIETEQQRADAIKLLRDTIHAVRRQAVESVARPIEIAATRMLRRIAGGRLGDVRLGDNLAPQGVSPRYAEADVTVDRLSGGEQEQLYFATRLSLAERVAEKQRQLVVFDDVLTATDAGRLARIQAILEESTDRLQVLILTCHPERYAGLAGSTTWDLEAAIEASRAAAM